MRISAIEKREPTPAIEIKPVRFAVSSGISLAADVAGPPDGVPVLLLHGGGQTRGAWRSATGMIAREGYRTVALDLRGHGESDWAPDGDYSFTTAAADVREIALGFGRPVVAVGASFGGMISMVAFGEAPRAPLAALVLVDVAPTINREGAERVRTFMMSGVNGFASVEEAADAVADYLPHRKRPPSWAGLVRNLRKREDDRFYWHWDPAFLNAFRNGEASTRNARFAAAIGQIDAPILLVRGGESDVVSRAEAEALRNLRPDAEIADIAGARHMIAGDSNTSFAATVVEFIRRVVPATPR